MDKNIKNLSIYLFFRDSGHSSQSSPQKDLFLSIPFYYGSIVVTSQRQMDLNLSQVFLYSLIFTSLQFVLYSSVSVPACCADKSFSNLLMVTEIQDFLKEIMMQKV